MTIPDWLPSVLVSPRIMKDKISKNVRGPRVTYAITPSEGATFGACIRYTFIKVRCFSFTMDHRSSQIQRINNNAQGKELLGWKYSSKSGFTVNNGHLRCYFLRIYSSVNMLMLEVGEKVRFVYLFLYYIPSNKQSTINNPHGKVIKPHEFISKSPCIHTWNAIWDVTFSKKFIGESIDIDTRSLKWDVLGFSMDHK